MVLPALLERTVVLVDIIVILEKSCAFQFSHTEISIVLGEIHLDVERQHKVCSLWMYHLCPEYLYD